MTEQNSANLQPKTQLASRQARLGASIIDSIIQLLILMPILEATHFVDYIHEEKAPPLELSISLLVISYLIYIGTHYYFIKKNGQTIGKRILNIRIENTNGGVASFNTIIFRRYLFTTAISSFPAIGIVLLSVDTLLIFRNNHACWHDDFAKTRVVKCN